MALKKINFGVMLDKLFRKTIYLRPLPDRTLEVINITGASESYLRDVTGATVIDPSCIVRVRGLKRVDYIALKLPTSTGFLNLFDAQKVVVSPPDVIANFPNASIPNNPIAVTAPNQLTICPSCQEPHLAKGGTFTVNIPDTVVSIPPQSIPVPKLEVDVPGDPTMTEKIFGDMLNYAEMAGRMQAEHNPEADKKMNWILIMCAAAIVVGIAIFFKMQGGA